MMSDIIVYNAKEGTLEWNQKTNEALWPTSILVSVLLFNNPFYNLSKQIKALRLGNSVQPIIS